MELFDVLTQLNACHAPSGDEGQLRELIAELAAPYVHDMRTDTMGNLIAHRAGTGPKLMLCAHMDSIGLIVTHFEKDGFVRVGRIGGVDAQEVVFSTVRFKNGVIGAVVKEEKADFAKLKADELILDIGADSQEQAKRMVQIGDTAVNDGNAKKLGDSKVVSPYIDNRISCAILLCALAEQAGSENDLYVVFSVQEEVGLRGAKTAAYAISPDYGIAVDVTTTQDAMGSLREGTTKLGNGAAIKVMDSSVICSSAVIALLEEIATTHEIPTQRDIMRGGGTDAGVMSTNQLGVLTGGISVPCRYIHTPVETADLRDADACVKLIAALINKKLQEV